MNTVVASDAAPGCRANGASARIALLGTGTVGSAVLARLGGWAGSPLGARVSLVYAANSRMSFKSTGAYKGWPPEAEFATAPEASEGAAQGWGRTLLQTLTPRPLRVGEGLDLVSAALGDRNTRIVVDATASDAVAARHADWLAQGIHVVTACKLGAGTTLARWRAIQAACVRGHTCYGDSATVGAGLPLLRAIRELKAGGDRIHAIAGVLSGSLAWLFDQYDGMRPFSALVRQARVAGYTEPDPREDLSGEDVRRKLLILARAAGVPLEPTAVSVASLVPSALSLLAIGEVDCALELLDAPLRARFAQAHKEGEVLRFVARLEGGCGRVGLEALAPAHPLAGGAGTDNRVAIWSDRYCERPLLIQGPGAGATVTAAALLDDVLRIAGGSTEAGRGRWR